MKLFIRPPQIIRHFYKDALWRMNKHEPKIFLTFDDGPIPELTPWILDLLNKYQIKATFFCVGENIDKYPDIFNHIIKDGHQVGNHTYNHLKGWNVTTNSYIENVMKCQTAITSNLFRPPYGKISKSQHKILVRHFKVVFWDVLSYDYDSFTSPEECLKNCIHYSRNGSIVVFHDNLKAEHNLKYTLPLFIEHFLNLNYKFDLL